MITAPQTPRGPDRLQLGEGGRWVDGRLVLTDILDGDLFETDVDTPALRRIAHLDVPLGAVAPIAGAPGQWIVAAGTGIALLNPGGSLQWLARPEDDNAVETRMNDGTADPAGRFWAGSMAYDNTPGAGSLYRVDGDGSITKAVDQLTIANGPAFNTDGSLMYLVDSARGHIDRYSVDVATGELGHPKPFLRVDENLGSPDGVTVDVQGNLWVAFWGGSAVRRYTPAAELDMEISLPALQPTSVCLGGPQMRRLYITTAHFGLAAADIEAAGHGGVFEVDVDIPGISAAHFHSTIA